jgi:hypothetical protein
MVFTFQKAEGMAESEPTAPQQSSGGSVAGRWLVWTAHAESPLEASSGLSLWAPQ